MIVRLDGIPIVVTYPDGWVDTLPIPDLEVECDMGKPIYITQKELDDAAKRDWGVEAAKIMPWFYHH